MNKRILIYGPQQSGKTLLAKQIASCFDKDEIVWMSEVDSIFSWHYFGICPENTKLIIIDNLRDHELKKSYDRTKHLIEVNPHMKENSTIDPIVILIAETDDINVINKHIGTEFKIIHKERL